MHAQGTFAPAKSPTRYTRYTRYTCIAVCLPDTPNFSDAVWWYVHAQGTFAPAKSVGTCTQLRCKAGTIDHDSDPKSACTACDKGMAKGVVWGRRGIKVWRTPKGKFLLLPPAPPYYPFPEEKFILGVVYGVLLWADMNAAILLGAWGRGGAPSLPCFNVGDKKGGGKDGDAVACARRS